MNFIFNEVPDCVSKTVFICLLQFTVDSFLNKFNTGFSERLKIKDDAVPTTLDTAVMPQLGMGDITKILFYGMRNFIQ